MAGRSRAARRRGVVRVRFTAATSMAVSRSPIFAISACPYDVCQSEPSVGRCRSEAPIPEPISVVTETNAVTEKRGTETARPATRLGSGRLRQRTSSPIRPPTQIEPAARWSQSRKRASARGAERAGQREQRGDRAGGTLGSVDPEYDRRSGGEQREHELQIEPAAAEGGHAHQRHERPDRPDGTESELGGGEEDVDRDRDERKCDRRPERDRERAQTGARNTSDDGADDDRPEDEEPDRRHQGEEGNPA